MKEELLTGREEMSTQVYHEILAKIRQLTLKEQLKLMEELVANLQQKVEEPSSHKDEEIAQVEVEEPPLHDIMEYAGFAKEVWKGIDVEAYLNEERNSWGG